MADSPGHEKPPGMDEKEHEVLDHQLNGLPTSGRGARTVFRFATPLDLVIIAISCFAAIVAGGLNPLLTVSTPIITLSKHL
jgi:ATP-binding cassette, subfamily B (MDR/TAP), member 1